VSGIFVVVDVRSQVIHAVVPQKESLRVIRGTRQPRSSRSRLVGIAPDAYCTAADPV